MVRDWGLIRNILTKIEDETLPDFLQSLHTDVQCGTGDASFESHVARHLQLLIEAGYVKGVNIGSTAPNHVMYVRVEPDMTMAGYDLLEVLRSKSTWSAVTKFFKDTGQAVTLESIKAAAAYAVKTALAN